MHPNDLENPQPTSSERREAIERRRTTLKSVAYGAVRGRRRGPRRELDPRPTYSDAYDLRVLLTTVAIVVLCCWDAHMTLKMLADGGRELNPAMDALLDVSAEMFLYVKIAMTIICILVLVLHKNVAVVGPYRVKHFILAILLGYLALVSYELVLWGPHWILSLLSA